METNPTFSPEEDKTAAIISYFTIVGWLIAYFAFYKDKKTAFSSYQLRQTLLFSIVAIVLGWILGMIMTALVISTGIFALSYLVWVVQIGLFIIWIIGLIGAINGEKKPMPLIGEKAQTIFSSI